MNFGRYDLITFDDDDKVVVLEVVLYNGKEYLYVNQVLPDESDTTDVYKVLSPNYNDGTFEKIIDLELLNVLLPMFQEKLKKYQ